MMYQEAFEKLTGKEAEAALSRINLAITTSKFEPENTTILAQNISFYPGYRFLDVADYSHVPPKKRFILMSDTDLVVLDHTNKPIYALNEKLPIKLNKDTVEDYVRFFFEHVRGQQGKFFIIEGVDDIKWKDDPPPSARKALSKLIEPVVYKGMDEKQNLLLKASIIFKDSLFKSKIRVQPNGHIILHDEELLIEDIPVLDDVLGQ